MNIEHIRNITEQQVTRIDIRIAAPTRLRDCFLWCGIPKGDIKVR